MRTTDRPTLQNFHIEGVKHINPTEALAAVKKGEAIMLDGGFVMWKALDLPFESHQ